MGCQKRMSTTIAARREQRLRRMFFGVIAPHCHPLQHPAVRRFMTNLRGLNVTHCEGN